MKNINKRALFSSWLVGVMLTMTSLQRPAFEKVLVLEFGKWVRIHTFTHPLLNSIQMEQGCAGG